MFAEIPICLWRPAVFAYAVVLSVQFLNHRLDYLSSSVRHAVVLKNSCSLIYANMLPI